MLTRSEVARRLGRSVATVRRLEGDLLHPKRDRRGVFRFDAEEVEALAARLADAGAFSRLSESTQDDGEPWDYESNRVEELQADVDHLRDQLGDAQHRARRADWELDRFKARTAEVLATLGRELMELDTDLGDVVLAAMRDLDA